MTGGSERHFLAGSGEMASLIRATDWSRTKLGPAEHWPHNLRTRALDQGARFYVALPRSR